MVTFPIVEQMNQGAIESMCNIQSFCRKGAGKKVFAGKVRENRLFSKSGFPAKLFTELSVIGVRYA